MAERIDLLIIDPQNDFCSPDANAKKGTPQEGNGVYEGTLYVPGAEKDMERLGEMVKKFGTKIKKIHVTLDCHHLIDVTHPLMWRNSDGQNPDPFSIFGSKEIKDGVWTPVFPSLRQKFIDYCEELETGCRYPLCIWPPHCLIGSPGNNVLPILFDTLQKWEENRTDNVDYVSKGSNPFTEHYSAVKAEVPDVQDPSTQLNTRLIQTLMEADQILIAGEAGSHCVKSTVEDIADGFQDDSYIKKMILLEDAVSPVQSPFVDFPAIQAQFIADMKARGMQTANTTDF
jgi:nicotinamidase/pyrazinamidase